MPRREEMVAPLTPISGPYVVCPEKKEGPRHRTDPTDVTALCEGTGSAKGELCVHVSTHGFAR